MARDTVGAFALHEALRRCVVGVSDPHVVQIPPFGGGEAATGGGMFAKVQTTSAKTVKTGGCGRGGLRFGRNVVNHGVLLAREPLNMRVNPLMRT